MRFSNSNNNKMLNEHVKIDPSATAQLRDHIKRLTKYILDNNCDLSRPNSFEKISMMVKDSILNFDGGKVKPTEQSKSTNTESRIARVTTSVSNKKLTCRLEDIEEKFKILNSLGRGFSRYEVLALKTSIFRLADSNLKASQIGYFGKIMGLQRDLHVFWMTESTATAKSNDVNMVDFFVSTDLQEWTKLPLISPEDFRAAKGWMKYWDFEQGTEALKCDRLQKRLKALLARIMFSNKICPEGFLITGEEEDSEPVRDPEFFLQADKLENAEGWIHELPYILKYGALAHKDYGTDEIKEKVEKLDPVVPRLNKISEEKRKWFFRIYDEKMPISAPDRENDIPQVQKTVAITNDLWPEALNYFSDAGKTFGFFYVGFGFKSQNSPLPKKLLPVEQEKVRDKLPEQKEPNPEDEALVFETESEPEPTTSNNDEND